MIDEGVGFPTGAATLLECVKKWLIRTPWESAQGAAPECTAATVLCELMELSRLWHLLYSMTRRCEEQQQQRTSYGAEHQSASPRTTDDGAQMNCTAVRQRLQHRFKHGGPYVRKLYRATRNTDAMFSSAASKEDCAAQVPLVGMGDIDAADMFWSLILYLSVALCWRRRSSLRAQHCRDACSEDIVSSSRGGSESHPRHLHSSSRSSRPESTRTSLSSSANYPSDPTPRIVTAGPTAAGETGEESLSAALRSHYTLDRAVADDVQSNRCRSVLQRLLPLLESRLSLSQLWRQPSLLAALDVLARGFAMAEGCVHASSLRDDARNTRRCPLCYAATLDNELAVEAFVHLRCYAAAYQGTGNTGVDAGTEQDWQRGGTRDAVNGAELSVWKRGWVAACRIALWNNCKASLDRLCCAPVSCAVTWWGQDQEAYRGVGRQRQQHAECRQLAILVEALWVGWWRAEVWLATYPSSFENSTMGTAIVRDAAARWRTALLFMQVVLPAAVAAARDPRAEDTVDDGGATGRRMKTERLNHQALLSHLVQLPLATEHPQAAGQCRQDKNKKPTCPSESCNAAPARGTVFHWLSQHGDVSLLTLFCRTLDGCTAAMPADQAPVCKSIAASAAAGTASEHTNQAHIVQLGSGRGRCGKALDRSSDRTALQMPEAAGHDAAARTPSFVSQPDPINPGRSLCTATSSLWGLQLVDTLGRNALDIACRRHHLPCVRLLLQAGLSPNSLATLAYDKRVDSLPLTVLNLLYDPSLLEGAGSFDNTSCGGLAQRLRQSTCPAAVASRILAQLSLRLWKEKVQQRSTMPQASDGKCFALDQWLSAYAQCQVAQDRVLRPAMAALELDAYEPTARLVVLSVLTRKLKDWLTTTPPFVRYPANDLPADNSDYPRREEVSSRTSSNTLSRPQLVQPSLRQLRLQHTAALRLYTQLTCPLGRALLRRAVDARCAVCDALTARENRAASVPLIASAATTTLSTAGTASGGRKVAEDEEKNAAAMSTATPLLSAPATSSLALTEPQKVRQELLDLYARVLTDAHALEECLLAEHHQRISAVGAVDGSSERDHRHGRTPPRHLRVTSTPTSGVATLLRGRDDDRHTATMPRPRRNGTGQSNSAPPLYALAVIPSEAALRSARWPAGALRVVEPTLWAFTNTPQKVWLRLPDGIDFDRLLHENSGGGFGVVADDMPLTAPVQRGDLVTFRCSRGGGGGGDDGGGGGRSGDISAIVKQKQRDVGGEERRHGAAFIVQRIFSEWRTLPYLVWRSATTEDKEHQHQPPPSSLVLPYAAAAVSPTGTGVPCMASPPEKIGTDPRRDSITLHACCVSVSYVARIASTQLRNHDPLDWLLQTRGTATHSSSSTESGMGDVLMTLQSSEEWTARWAQTVWAGYQPCWLSNEKNPVVDGIPCSQGDISELAKDGVALCDSNVGLRKRQCEAITCSPSCSSEGCVRDVVHLTDPFSTWDDADAARAHHRFAIHGGGRSLRVLLTSTRGDGGGRHEAQRISLEADWPRRAEAPSASATADVVVGSALGM
ncbi:hypothetical protein JKF63_06927 [Porcisia hertigi]|uniref:Uncharacterized protein n=1 Tax=Porcisia hertigi TaxID=2761500 RepID=A0A836YGH4_9TRYP|nr:hypothetical protein JKF63_06927 [Porcisia hertigi]